MLLQAIDMDEDGAAMLEFIQEIKRSPNYQKNFSENTKRSFNLYEKALCKDSKALIELSAARGHYA